jgi:hypothetical protein
MKHIIVSTLRTAGFIALSAVDARAVVVRRSVY